MKIKKKPFMNAVLTRPESIKELATKVGISSTALYSALNTERSSLETLTKLCKVIGGKELNIALNDKFSPAAFTEPGNDNFIYVATPVRA